MQLSAVIIELQDVLKAYGDVDCLVENKLNLDYEEPKIFFSPMLKTSKENKSKIQKACVISSNNVNATKPKEQLKFKF